MNRIIRPSEIQGVIAAPPSKSLSQRAIAAGLLARGTTVIRNLSFCDDSIAALGIAEKLGAGIKRENEIVKIMGGGDVPDDLTLHCSESGLALRMFSPVAALLCGRVRFTGEGSLVRRPVMMINEALSQLGVKVDTTGGFLPITLSRRLSGGKATIDGSAGSQILTGLLMALPLANSDSEVTVHGLTSAPYVSLTLQLLSEFGIVIQSQGYKKFIIGGNQHYNAREYTVEGDWSGAAFLLVAGAVAGEMTVLNLNPESLQADRAVADVLKMAGADLHAGESTIKVKKTRLKAFSFDATDSPDLFPPLAALAACCKGTSVIKGVRRLEHKESDRAMAIMQVLGAMNIKTYVVDDEMFIKGGRITGSVISSHGDHRIAMMAAVTALAGTGPVMITGAEAVTKSFPRFFEALAASGASVNTVTP